MSELYNRLGVSRDASTDEIRKSFREKARVTHPDKGGDVEEFKKLQEAYEVLSDSDRRKMYDMTGTVGNVAAADPTEGMAAGRNSIPFMSGMGPFGMPGVAFDMGSMFGNLFGGGGGPRKPQRRGGRGPNKHVDIGLTLSDFYHGKEIKSRFNQERRCEPCNGSGAEASEPCGACSGSGMRVMMKQIGPGMLAQSTMPCDVCSGEGKRITRTCRNCHGKKMLVREKQLDIKIIPGMVEGEQMVFAGECSDTPEYDLPGDVVLTLRRADTSDGEVDVFEWKGDALWIRKKITFAESILGFKRSLSDHPSGGAPVVSWRGGPLLHGAVLQLADLGMPRKSGGFGTLFFQVLVEAPPTRPWSAEEAAKLQSVLGGSAATLDESGVQTLLLSSADSKLVVSRT